MGILFFCVKKYISEIIWFTKDVYRICFLYFGVFRKKIILVSVNHNIWYKLLIGFFELKYLKLKSKNF